MLKLLGVLLLALVLWCLLAFGVLWVISTPEAHARSGCRTRNCIMRVTVRPHRATLKAIRRCETPTPSSQYRNPWRAATGNGFFGGLQFTLRSWAGVGGHGNPARHGALEQMYRAVLLMRQQGWGAWPVCRHAAGV